MMEKINIAGITCYKNQPKGTKVANLDDFNINNKKNIGMKFFLQGFYSGLFEEYTVSESLRKEDIIEWVEVAKCFVKITN